jgi:hypothetical protein
VRPDARGDVDGSSDDVSRSTPETLAERPGFGGQDLVVNRFGGSA